MGGATPGVRKTTRGALLAPDRWNDPSHATFYYGIMRNKSLKILQPLEQLTSSRHIMIVGFWLSLLRCSSAEPGHNRSSSPFTTLADIAERRVASTGAGQPNYSPKTRFEANAYNAKFGVPNLYIRSVQALLPYCGATSSPWRT